MALPDAFHLHLTSFYLPGVFNMWVVIADYLLVITWFACTTVCLERLTSKACSPSKNQEPGTYP